jgi:hypothetical protein
VSGESSASRFREPFAEFPTRSDHEQRWLELAAAIAARRTEISEDPGASNGRSAKGQLIVIGSGIEEVSFTGGDERLLRDADEVFYCVADPATSVWIKALRPDAYDLYVLYDDSKLRYVTYMQMSEAMLYFVREGRRVVAVYYGHPGIFVLSTHRAIQIARREGHRAVMRAGISALDTLCADLGVDPSHPGMQTFEATDMLIRRRRLDTSVHLVLWQVGLIGELGYRRQGFFNRGFSLLLDYLEASHGPDHEVINYTGSRYPGIDPVIVRHTVSSLRDPATQQTVTGISTFYLPPKEAVAADPRLLEELGLMKPGQSPKAPTSAIRQIARYGAREMKAFDDFARFRVPTGYHWQEDTVAARFLLALRDERALREQYEHDPSAALAGWAAAGLGPGEQALLARREAGLAQIAAKGLLGNRDRDRENERMLSALLAHRSQARDLLRRVRAAGDADGSQALERWSTEHDFRANWDRVPADLGRLLRSSLAPWTGLFVASEREVSVFVLGSQGPLSADRVFVDGEYITGAVYERGVLLWRAEDGNPTSGHLRTDLATRGERRLVGMIWPAGKRPRSEDRIVAVGHPLPAACAASIAGAYHGQDPEGRSVDVLVTPRLEDPDGPDMQVLVDGRPSTGPPRIQADSFEVDDIRVPLAHAVQSGSLPDDLVGSYALRVSQSNGSRLVALELQTDSLSLDGRVPIEVTHHGRVSSWSGGPLALAQGSVTAVLDPITLRPMLYGRGRSAQGATSLALAGMVPVTAEERSALADHPRLGFVPWTWRHLVGIASDASSSGGLFLWHRWDMAAVALQMLQAALREAQT